jgi:hypothetical protein
MEDSHGVTAEQMRTLSLPDLICYHFIHSGHIKLFIARPLGDYSLLISLLFSSQKCHYIFITGSIT